MAGFTLVNPHPLIHAIVGANKRIKVNNKIKLGILAGIALLLIACGGGTATPKKKPSGYVTPSPKVTVLAGDRCSPKGATMKIKGKKYTCKEVSARDKTLRWRR